MSTKFEIPTPQSVTALLAMIFGEDLSSSKCDAPDLAGNYVATFIDDDDRLVGLCVCDKEFVAYSGAALSMLPADVAKEMIAGNSVTDAMVDNFYEVMNICSKLFMSETSAHLRLDKIVKPADGAEPIATLESAAKVAPFDVDIPRYGKGALIFLVT